MVVTSWSLKLIVPLFKMKMLRSQVKLLEKFSAENKDLPVIDKKVYLSFLFENNRRRGTT